jgi:hypothetical protein
MASSSSHAGQKRQESNVSKGLSPPVPRHGGYSGYFADPDGHPWEVVVAPGIEVGEDGRVHLPD